ncbi:hypothetical protein V3C99_003078 [Haemonchus contortus]
MDGEEKSPMEAYMTDDYYVKHLLRNEDCVAVDQEVVIGEGEDHEYCDLEPLSYSFIEYEPFPEVQYEPSLTESNDGLDILVDHVEVVNSSSAECYTSDNPQELLVVSNEASEKPLKPPNVYVKRDRTWKFQKNTVVATCGENGQFFYHPDPFSPVPPFKGAPSAVKRMEYAARRIDNRKYRDQHSKVLASDQLDSATCSKCKMRFFLPFRHFKNRITYRVPENPYLLPMPRFRCPLCEEDSTIEL